MNRVEFITHCWAKQLDQYAWHLQLQLSSIFYYAPLEAVHVTVCYSPEDEATVAVLDFFKEKLGGNIRCLAMPRSHLLRRAIGRNLAALNSTADVIWFADVDYFWKEGAFEALCRFPIHLHRGILMPSHVWRHKDWATGDALVESMRRSGVGLVRAPSDDDFVLKRERIAIGGMQIVSGDVCREVGYLNGTRWVTPLHPAPHSFVNFRDDIAFRRSLAGARLHRIDIPQVYRVRHTEQGYGRQFG